MSDTDSSVPDPVGARVDRALYHWANLLIQLRNIRRIQRLFASTGAYLHSCVESSLLGRLSYIAGKPVKANRWNRQASILDHDECEQ